MKDMEKRVELEKRGLPANKVLELNLDNCRSPTLVGLTDEFVNLQVLSLINVGLTSLKGFPKLPNLKKLELSDNRISGGLNLLHTSPKLSSLNLSGNRIEDLETLEPLKELKNLKSLDLFNNEATGIDNYRAKVFGLLPGLKYLDGFDIDDVEAEDSDDDEEINGFNSDDDDEHELEESASDLEEEEDLGLEAVYQDNLDEESEGDVYEGVLDEEDDDLEEEVEEEDWGIVASEEEDSGEQNEQDSTPRGKKRKLEDEDEN